jgi:hypothetical protein
MSIDMGIFVGSLFHTLCRGILEENIIFKRMGDFKVGVSVGVYCTKGVMMN